MVLIGIDPHKGSHTAVVIDSEEKKLAEVRVRADRRQLERLIAFAAPFEQRTWAVESAAGLGYLLSQQLVGVGEDVIDVPATLSSKVRLLTNGSPGKTDPNDALSTAVAALRYPALRTVTAEDHAGVLRLLADRNHDLGRLRTQAICRLHAVLCTLTAGGERRRLSAKRAGETLARITPATAVEAERKRLGEALLADVRHLDAQIADIKRRIAEAVTASATTVTDVYGVGPVVAAFVIGHTGDVNRFADAGSYASYNATAPIEASSGPRKRHRLNPRGNRMLNHAIHIAAVCQIRNDTPGRAYYQRKLAEGKSHKEALRALKRRISDVVFRRLVVDTRR